MKSATALRPVPDPRAELRARIEQQEKARQDLERSAAAMERARRAVNAAQADVGNFRDLDDQTAAARAAMLRRGESGSLPDDVIRQREARRAAEEHLAEVSAALELLQREHVDAEKALQRVTGGLAYEAYKILLREGAVMGDELKDLKQRVWTLTDRLTALDRVIGAGTLGEVRMRLGVAMAEEWRRISAALNLQEPMYAPSLDPTRHVAERLREWHRRLQVDPDAPVAWEE
jgi:DNA repair exonuclease SbcCD ATPase subunit